MQKTDIHDHPVYLICPDLLCALGDTSYGIRLRFIGSAHSLHYLFMYYLYLRCKIYSYPATQTEIIISQQKGKQPLLFSSNNNLCFWWPHSIPPHSYSTASVSHPIPLSAAKRFPRFKLSVCTLPYLSPTVLWTHRDSLNLKRKAPNYPQLTPAVSLCCRLHLKCDGTRWRTGGEVKGKLANGVHTTSEHAVSIIATADAHTSAASSRLNWRSRWFKWTRPFGRKTKSGFCACTIIFQLTSTNSARLHWHTWICRVAGSNGYFLSLIFFFYSFKILKFVFINLSNKMQWKILKLSMCSISVTKHCHFLKWKVMQ